MGRPEVLLGTLLGVALAAVVSSCGGGSEVTCAPEGTYVPTAVRSASPGDCPATVPEPTWGTVTVTATKKMCGASTHKFIEGGGGSGPAAGAWCGADGTTVLTATEAGISGRGTVIATACATTMTCTANYDLTYARQ